MLIPALACILINWITSSSVVELTPLPVSNIMLNLAIPSLNLLWNCTPEPSSGEYSQTLLGRSDNLLILKGFFPLVLPLCPGAFEIPVSCTSEQIIPARPTRRSKASVSSVHARSEICSFGVAGPFDFACGLPCFSPLPLYHSSTRRDS